MTSQRTIQFTSTKEPRDNRLFEQHLGTVKRTSWLRRVDSIGIPTSWPFVGNCPRQNCCIQSNQGLQCKKACKRTKICLRNQSIVLQSKAPQGNLPVQRRPVCSTYSLSKLAWHPSIGRASHRDPHAPSSIGKPTRVPYGSLWRIVNRLSKPVKGSGQRISFHLPISITGRFN